MENTDQSSVSAKPAAGGAAPAGGGGGKEKIEKQARQLAYDTRYKVRQTMSQQSGGKADPAAVRKAYMAQLGKSPAPPAVKARAKQMLLGENIVNVEELLSKNVSSVIDKVFVEGIKKEEEVIEEDSKGEKTFKVRVTDKKTGNTYIRNATRDKIRELRANPNISSVEMTEYGEPTKSEKHKGGNTAAVKSGKGDEISGKDTSIDLKKEEYSSLKSENFDGFLELVEKSKEDKKGKITGEGVNNSKLVKVFPNDVKEESDGPTPSDYAPASSDNKLKKPKQIKPIETPAVQARVKEEKLEERVGGAGTLVRQGVRVGGKKGGRAVQKGQAQAIAAGQGAKETVKGGNPDKMVGSGKFEKTGAVIGGVGGALAGGVLDGPLPVGDIVGGIAGGKLGGKIGRQFDKMGAKKPVGEEYDNTKSPDSDKKVAKLRDKLSKRGITNKQDQDQHPQIGEAVENLDELTNTTLLSYNQKAANQLAFKGDGSKKAQKRATGVKKATARLAIRASDPDGSMGFNKNPKNEETQMDPVVAATVNNLDEFVGSLAGTVAGAKFLPGVLAKAGLKGTAGKIAGAGIGAAAGEVLDPFKKGKNKNPVSAAVGGAAGTAAHGAIKGALQKSSYEPETNNTIKIVVEAPAKVPLKNTGNPIQNAWNWFVPPIESSNNPNVRSGKLKPGSLEAGALDSMNTRAAKANAPIKATSKFVKGAKATLDKAGSAVKAAAPIAGGLAVGLAAKKVTDKVMGHGKKNEEVVLEADSLSGQVSRWEAARQKRMKQRQSYERPSWIPRDQDHEDNWGSSKGEKKKPQKKNANLQNEDADYGYDKDGNSLNPADKAPGTVCFDDGAALPATIKPIGDPREMSTALNLIKNKWRAKGLKMSYEPKGDHLGEDATKNGKVKLKPKYKVEEGKKTAAVTGALGNIVGGTVGGAIGGPAGATVGSVAGGALGGAAGGRKGKKGRAAVGGALGSHFGALGSGVGSAIGASYEPQGDLVDENNKRELVSKGDLVTGIGGAVGGPAGAAIAGGVTGSKGRRVKKAVGSTLGAVAGKIATGGTPAGMALGSLVGGKIANSYEPEGKLVEQGIEDILARLEKKRISKGGNPDESPLGKKTGRAMKDQQDKVRKKAGVKSEAVQSALSALDSYMESSKHLHGSIIEKKN